MKKTKAKGQKGFFKELESKPKREKGKHENLDWKKEYSGKKAEKKTAQEDVIRKLNRQTKVKAGSSDMITEAKAHKAEYRGKKI